MKRVTLKVWGSVFCWSAHPHRAPQLLLRWQLPDGLSQTNRDLGPREKSGQILRPISLEHTHVGGAVQVLGWGRQKRPRRWWRQQWNWIGMEYPPCWFPSQKRCCRGCSAYCEESSPQPGQGGCANLKQVPDSPPCCRKSCKWVANRQLRGLRAILNSQLPSARSSIPEWLHLGALILHLSPRLRAMQTETDKLWRCWSLESNLSIQNKLHTTQRNVAVGDSVWVSDQNALGGQIRLGKVVSTNLGSRGIVRDVNAQIIHHHQVIAYQSALPKVNKRRKTWGGWKQKTNLHPAQSCEMTGRSSTCWRTGPILKPKLLTVWSSSLPAEPLGDWVGGVKSHQKTKECSKRTVEEHRGFRAILLLVTSVPTRT